MQVELVVDEMRRSLARRAGVDRRLPQFVGLSGFQDFAINIVVLVSCCCWLLSTIMCLIATSPNSLQSKKVESRLQGNHNVPRPRTATDSSAYAPKVMHIGSAKYGWPGCTYSFASLTCNGHIKLYANLVSIVGVADKYPG